MKTDSGQIQTPWQLPKWLPKAVADFAGVISADRFPMLHLDRPLRLRLRRLTTDSRMEFVWRQLARGITKISQTPGPFQVHRDHIATFADAFLRGYLITAMNADSRAAYWERAPSAQQQQTMIREIQDHAHALLRLLGDPCDYRNWTSWDALTVVIYSAGTSDPSVLALLKHLAKQTYGRYWSVGQAAEGKAQDGTNSMPVNAHNARSLLGDLPSQLQALEVLSKLSLEGDDETQIKPPYKTKQLRKTVYVRALSRIVKSQGLRPRQSKGREAGFALHKIVAITANVALDLSGTDELRAETVRKFVAETR
jgi:hypothetical protein